MTGFCTERETGTVVVVGMMLITIMTVVYCYAKEHVLEIIQLVER